MDKNTLIPQAFIDKMAEVIPEGLTLTDLVNYCQTPLRKSIRVNTLKISVDTFKAIMDEQQWLYEPIPWCQEGFWIDRYRDGNSSVPLGSSFEHMAGLFYIQEASSMIPPEALWHNESGTFTEVLDVASAPGSKTTQLAALMNNDGFLVANEYSASRIKALHANVRRTGVKNVALTNFDGRIFGQYMQESFDAILLDAPCSGEGTVRKDPDVFKSWSEDLVSSIAETQKELLESAFHALKSGGALLYSTCTLNHQENQDVCHYLKEKYGDCVEFESLGDLFEGAEKSLTPEGFLHVWPQHYNSGGFFIAKIRKRGKDYDYPAQKTAGVNKFPFTPATKKQIQTLNQYLNNQFGFTLHEDDGALYTRESELWLFPNALKHHIGKVKFSRIGNKIADILRHGFRLQHEMAISLGHRATLNSVELTLEEVKTWYQGKDVPHQYAKKGGGEILVTHNGAVLGFGKALAGKIKNSLPRELVKDHNIIY